MLFVGLDIGSTTSKAVIINEREEIVSFSIIRNSFDLAESGKRAYVLALENARADQSEIKFIASTGYGRRSIGFQNLVEPEVICHAKGIIKLFPSTRTIIDIGGQDSKVIELNGTGEVVKFQMNDKCAAGSGRYLDKLAKDLFQIEVEKLGELALKSKNPLTISSQCTVFAETEIISYLSQKKPIEDIIAGMHYSLAKRVIEMGRAGFIRFTDPVVFSGGVAKNVGMVKAIEDTLKTKVLVPPEPQLTAALGAALFAMEGFLKSLRKEVIM
jgi:predicted CoA-substrate-specific enzyme activase